MFSSNKFTSAKMIFKSVLKNVALKNCKNNNFYESFLTISTSCTHKKETHFGFQTVDEDVKTQKVHAVFEQVANSYDKMNDAMSLGVHRIWKDIFVERLSPMHGSNLLDVAGGTGDISFRLLNHLQHNSNQNYMNKRSQITVCDINQAMLDVGKQRFQQLNLQDDSVNVNWVCGDAENLQFEDHSFSAYTIAFGIRNVTHIDKVLKEAHRVLKLGGRFMCLEFSQLNNQLLQKIYDVYSFEVIPPMGQILAGQWHPYQYLVESIRKFPPQEEFKDMIKAAGFSEVCYENLSFGVCSIHSGFKL